MKIVNVKAKNFLSHKDFDFEIPNGVHLITGYNYDDSTSNGAGKSSIMDMLVFAMFGTLPRNIKVDEICSVFGDGSAMVDVELLDAGNTYRIYRSRKPNELRLFKNGIEVSAKDAKEAQSQIERTLGIDYSIFVNSVYFYQNAQSHFVSASDAEKRDILTNLLNLDIFDTAFQLVSEKIKTETLNKATLDSQIISISSKMNSNDEDVKSYTLAAEQHEDRKRVRIENLRQRNVSILEEISCLNSERATLISGLEKLEEYSKSVEIIGGLILGLEPIRKEISGIESEVSRLKYAISEEKNKESKFRDLIAKKQCLACYQPISESNYSGELSGIASKIADFQKNIEEREAQIPGLRSKLAEEGRYRKDKEFFIGELSRMRASQQRISGIESNIVRKTAEIESVESEISAVIAEKSDYEGMIDKKIKENAGLLGEYHAKKNLNTETTKKISIYTGLKAVYRNIKYFVFESVVGELNSRVCDYVQALFDTDVSLVFDTSTETKKGDIKQKFSVTLTKEGIERNFNSLSGGEKRRIEIATNFAMSDIIANRSGKAFEFMMLDECFEGLDNEGRNRVVELLEVLREKRSNILIIDHFETMKTLVDTEIRIEKRNGESRLVA